jgi:tRNA(fMet)-specific endonuclease VapC
MTADVAEACGTIRSDLAAGSEATGSNDLWIAAYAKSPGLILVTNNEGEFQTVSGLTAESWGKDRTANEQIRGSAPTIRRALHCESRII